MASIHDGVQTSSMREGKEETRSLTEIEQAAGRGDNHGSCPAALQLAPNTLGVRTFFFFSNMHICTYNKYMAKYRDIRILFTTFPDVSLCPAWCTDAIITQQPRFDSFGAPVARIYGENGLSKQTASHFLPLTKRKYKIDNF